VSILVVMVVGGWAGGWVGGGGGGCCDRSACIVHLIPVLLVALFLNSMDKFFSLIRQFVAESLNHLSNNGWEAHMVVAFAEVGVLVAHIFVHIYTRAHTRISACSLMYSLAYTLNSLSLSLSLSSLSFVLSFFSSTYSRLRFPAHLSLTHSLALYSPVLATRRNWVADRSPTTCS
jgi:hypothetical protein